MALKISCINLTVRGILLDKNLATEAETRVLQYPLTPQHPTLVRVTAATVCAK